LEGLFGSKESSTDRGRRLANIVRSYLEKTRGSVRMTDIDRQFAQAQDDVTRLPERPGNLTLLRLYALFKQASAGDVHGDRPGLADVVGKYKYDAWAALKGTPADDAKQRYVELVESLKRGEAA
jgi:acyl-CoA-binding protein